jgi:hypothetical protein
MRNGTFYYVEECVRNAFWCQCPLRIGMLSGERRTGKCDWECALVRRNSLPL